ncbi:MAG TPA: hypothetical protein VM889_02190 [Candidatus Thermoplasmatota archaeon]|nr:hypothetical protein [Candidatus Thermoplasmatota archaeon]
MALRLVVPLLLMGLPAIVAASAACEPGNPPLADAGWAYVDPDGAWIETNGVPGLQREEGACGPSDTPVVAVAHPVGLGDGSVARFAFNGTRVAAAAEVGGAGLWRLRVAVADADGMRCEESEERALIGSARLRAACTGHGAGGACGVAVLERRGLDRWETVDARARCLRP